MLEGDNAIFVKYDKEMYYVIVHGDLGHKVIFLYIWKTNETAQVCLRLGTFLQYFVLTSVVKEKKYIIFV